MPYFLLGSTKQLAQAFGQLWMIDQIKESGSRLINTDLPGTLFHGNTQDAEQFISIWQHTVVQDYYLQGNMTGGNLPLILGLTFPFKKKNEDLETWKTQYARHHFAYLNDKKEPCGLVLSYRLDEPQSWLLGVIINTHLMPDERTVAILSSDTLIPLFKDDINVPILSGMEYIDQFKLRTGSKAVKQLLDNLLSEDNQQLKINPLKLDSLLYPLSQHRLPDAGFNQLLVSNLAYADAYFILQKLGLDKEMPSLLANTNKRIDLQFIHGLTDTSCKKLCLIFWVKHHLTIDKLKELVTAAEKYPHLFETLLHLHQETSLDNLVALALNPQKHLPKTIKRLFAAEFKQYAMEKPELKVNELEALHRALDVLKHCSVAEKDTLFQMVVKNNHQGKLFRIFLLQLSAETDDAIQNELITFLHTGIEKGPITQASILKDLAKDTSGLKAAALHQRYICTKHILELELSDEIVAFAAEKENILAQRFRSIIMAVEAQCDLICERLASATEARTAWSNIDKNYRKALYKIAYNGLTTPSYDYENQIKEEDSKVLAVVDPELESALQQSLIILANILITALSVGLANLIKGHKTGNYWFFSQTKSGEEVRLLQQQVVNELRGLQMPG